MIKEIRKEEIPDWDFGDIAIKTFSFGDQNYIASIMAKIRGKSIDDADVGLKDDISIDVLNVNSLAAGLHYIKGKDNISFVLKPNLHRTEKINVCDKDISFTAGQYILKQITILNNPISEDQKKN